jgi:hypothetical protein
VVSADWRFLRPDETEYSLEGDCLVCELGWPDPNGCWVDISVSDVWAHPSCVVAHRGDMSSREYLNWVVEEK